MYSVRVDWTSCLGFVFFFHKRYLISDAQVHREAQEVGNMWFCRKKDAAFDSESIQLSR